MSTLRVESIPFQFFWHLLFFDKHLAAYLNRLGIHNKLVFGKSLSQQPHVS